MNIRFFILLLIIFQFSCSSKERIRSIDDGLIDFTVFQLNDVYEIAPLAGGKIGGMARVATVLKQLEKENPNTLALLSGDFLNPSLIGTMKLEGERIHGKQMVELMNAVGIDLVTLGNHEFDLDENDLQKRINESNFVWVVGNYDQICGDRHYPFYKEKNGEKEFFPSTYTWKISDSDGTQATIGFFGAGLEIQDIDYVHYTDYLEKSRLHVDKLKSYSDIITGITHLALEEDMELAKYVPETAILFGGHEHDNMIHQVGDTRITKADANAKSAYIHHFQLDKKTGKHTISSELVILDESISLDPEIHALVEKWNKVLKENITKIVDRPFEVIYTTKEPLDGRESSVRNKQTNLGRLITDAMQWSTQGKCAAAIFNSGGIRIDDQLHDGITPVDIFRVLPFGGATYMAEFKGSLLKGVLDYGSKAKGSGAYLQLSGLEKKNDVWKIKGKDILDDQNYWVAINDYLTFGKDIHFLNEDNPGLISVVKPENNAAKKIRGDIRATIIQYLQLRK